MFMTLLLLRIEAGSDIFASTLATECARKIWVDAHREPRLAQPLPLFQSASDISIPRPSFEVFAELMPT
jgi:hypothetical protein